MIPLKGLQGDLLPGLKLKFLQFVHFTGKNRFRGCSAVNAASLQSKNFKRNGMQGETACKAHLKKGRAYIEAHVHRVCRLESSTQKSVPSEEMTAGVHVELQALHICAVKYSPFQRAH